MVSWGADDFADSGRLGALVWVSVGCRDAFDLGADDPPWRALIAEIRSAFRIPETPLMPSWPASFLSSGSSMEERPPERVEDASTIVVSVTVIAMSFQDELNEATAAMWQNAKPKRSPRFYLTGRGRETWSGTDRSTDPRVSPHARKHEHCPVAVLQKACQLRSARTPSSANLQGRTSQLLPVYSMISRVTCAASGVGTKVITVGPAPEIAAA